MSISNRIYFVVGIALLLMSLSGCGKQHQESITVTYNAGINGIWMDHGKLVIHAKGQPDAHVSANGDFDIGGKPVAIGVVQRAQLAHYYQQAIGFAKRGAAVGEAGAALAGSVVGDVFSNLFSGHADRIGAVAQRKADGLKATASRLCEQVDAMRVTQNEIAADLPAFGPYAMIKADVAKNCHDGLK